MPNGVRNSIWAVFFLAGMAFMATLIFMLRPDVFSNSGVREKPGSRVMLGGYTEPETSLAVAEAETTDMTVQPAPQVAASRKQTPPPAKAESRRAAPPEQIQETNPEPVVAEELSTPRAAAIPEAHGVVATGRHVRVGRSVFGHVILLGELPPPKSLPVADGFCGLD